MDIGNERKIQGIVGLGKTTAGEYFLLDLALLLPKVVHKNGIILQKGKGKEGSRSQSEIQYFSIQVKIIY